MNDIAFYEFLLKLNTYLNRTNLQRDKFARQELDVREKLVEIRQQIPKTMFDKFFEPLVETFDERVKLLQEMKETDEVFEQTLKEYFDLFRGIVQ